MKKWTTLLLLSVLFLSACQNDDQEVKKVMTNEHLEKKLKKAQSQIPNAMPPFDEILIEKPEYNTIHQMLSDMVRMLQPNAEEQWIYSSSFDFEKHVANSTYLYTGHFLTFGTIKSDEMKNDIIRLQKYANAIRQNEDEQTHKQLFQTFQEYLTTLNEKYKKEEE